MKVIVGRSYVYNPVPMDVIDNRVTDNVKPGDLVEVVNLSGCPPANTMGMCYIRKDGVFAGMVYTNSLSEKK